MVTGTASGVVCAPAIGTKANAARENALRASRIPFSLNSPVPIRGFSQTSQIQQAPMSVKSLQTAGSGGFLPLVGDAYTHAQHTTDCVINQGIGTAAALRGGNVRRWGVGDIVHGAVDL